MRAMVERANLGEVEMELITHAHTLNHQPLHLGGGGGGGGEGAQSTRCVYRVGGWRLAGEYDTGRRGRRILLVTI